MQGQQDSFSALYLKYQDGRLLTKWQNYALWTIPSIFPDINSGKDTTLLGNAPLEHDYQSIGALLVNSLSSKMTNILFPINQAFFKLQPSAKTKELFARLLNTEIKQIDDKLISTEQAAHKRLFLNAGYSQLTQLIGTLIVCGDAILYRENNSFITYAPRNYGLVRDMSGNVLDCVIKEGTTFGELSPALRAKVEQGNPRKDLDPAIMYTRIKRGLRKGNVVYTVSQEVEGVSVGKPSVYPVDLCPYIFCAWKIVSGNSYGSGYVEDYAGDFAKLSDLSRALAIYEIDACKVVNCVKPGAGIDVDSFHEAENGDWIQADPQAVVAHEGGQANKIQQLSASINTIFTRLSTAFMWGGNTRDAERVTAEEIRRQAKEADQMLGGAYSMVSGFVHQHLAYLLLVEADSTFQGAIVGKEYELNILTGTSALGRATEIQSLVEATQICQAVIPILSQLSQRFDTETTIDRIFSSFGLNISDWVFTAEELRQKEMAANAAAQNSVDTMAPSLEELGGVV